MKKHILLCIFSIMPVFGDRFGPIQYELPPAIAKEWDVGFVMPGLFRLYAPIATLDFLESDDSDGDIKEAEELFVVWCDSDQGKYANPFGNHLESKTLPFGIFDIQPNNIIDYSIAMVGTSSNCTLYQWHIKQAINNEVDDADALLNQKWTVEAVYGWTRIFFGSNDTVYLAYITTNPLHLECAESNWVPALEAAVYDR